MRGVLLIQSALILFAQRFIMQSFQYYNSYMIYHFGIGAPQGQLKINVLPAG